MFAKMCTMDNERPPLLLQQQKQTDQWGLTSRHLHLFAFIIQINYFQYCIIMHFRRNFLVKKLKIPETVSLFPGLAWCPILYFCFIYLCAWLGIKPPKLARACGVPVGRCSGGRLAMTLVATINDIIFFFLGCLPVWDCL